MSEEKKLIHFPEKKPNNRRMIVETINSHGWYKKGETHEVGCYISLAYTDRFPCYEKGKGRMGIRITDCKIIKVLPE